MAWYFLPSVNEWYKAAYYDLAAGIYYDYPTGSDTAPVSVAGGTVLETAVYGQDLSVGPAEITQAGGLSPYETMAQGGNVDEWNETDFRIDYTDLDSRAVRGGDWYRSSDWLSPIAVVGDYGPTGNFLEVGFRVASIVPEPGASALFATGLMTFFGFRRWYLIERRHCHAQHIRWPENFGHETRIEA